MTDFAALTDPYEAQRILEPVIRQSGDIVIGCRILHADYRTYVKARDRASLTISYELTLHGGDGSPRLEIFHGRAYLGKRMEDEIAAVRHRPPIHIGSAGLMLWRFPDDDGLPQLTSLYDLDVVRRELPSGFAASPEAPQVVNYRPGRRCVLRYATSRGGVYAKTYGDDCGFTVASRLRQLTATPAPGFHTPRLLVYSEPLRTVFVEEIEGRMLLDVLNRDNCESLMGQICAYLRTFQQTPCEAGCHRTINDHLEEARKKIRRLTRTFPAQHARLTGLLTAIEATVPDDSQISVVHGDFHAGQILVDHTGRPALFDFDEIHRSDPAFDVANFIADLYAQRTHLDAGFSRAAATVLQNASGLPPDRLQWHVRVQLLTRAWRCWLKQIPHMEARVPMLIDLAEMV